MKITYQIVYWRDIPAQLRFRNERERFSKKLSSRFQEAIDEAAMRARTTGADEYLEDWRTSEWLSAKGDPQQQAEAVVIELEAAYSLERLEGLVSSQGYETLP
ncbi:MAG TPA: virulence factor [Anaerolineales bacterium]|nr:virulence factor [Anaerolineales bacterium]